MSKSVQKILKNSFLQIFNVLASAGLNFVLMLVYARLLGPSQLGALVTAQAQVLIWVIVIDLGMTAGLIGALHQAEAQRDGEDRQGFRAFDLIKQVFMLRLCGVALGSAAIFYLSYLSAHADGEFHRDIFFQGIAYTPFLLAHAFHYTAASYAMFRGRQATCTVANLTGIAATVLLALVLAWKDFAIPYLLLAQSWGGFLSAALIVGSFFVFPEIFSKENFRQKKGTAHNPWKKNALQALFADVWPHTVGLAATSLWQRLDQITASHMLGNAAGGQYALAIRLVSIPIMIAAGIHMALFPDLQRVGRDAPEKISLYVAAMSKFLVRYGVVVAGLLLAVIAACLVPILPKFKPALLLFPWFLPGVCAYWIANIMLGSLFGVRKYKEVAFTYIIAICLYAAFLPFLTKVFALYGVITSFNIFTVALFLGAQKFVCSAGVLEKNFSIFAAFTEREKEFLASIQKKFLSILKKSPVDNISNPI